MITFDYILILGEFAHLRAYQVSPAEVFNLKVSLGDFLENKMSYFAYFEDACRSLYVTGLQ